MEINLHQSDIDKELAKRNILDFTMRMHPDFVVNHHHKLISDDLHKIISGEITRLMIFMPPRHSKSMMVSEMLPPFYFGKHPENQVVSATYGQDLSNDFGRKVRNTMTTEEYLSIFPDSSLAQDSKSASKFSTLKGGTYNSVGVGGSLTGKGGHIIICDDLIKNYEDARSPIKRRALLEWFKTVLYTRLMPNGRIILMMTRWTDNDIAATLLSEDIAREWKILSLPAINDKGKALFPQFYDIKALKRIKRDIGTKHFEALYQQNPRPSEGGIIKRKWLKYYNVLPKMDKYVQSWDLSFKGEVKNDFVVGQCWGIKGGDFYLVDQVRDRLDFPATLKAMISFSNKHPRALKKLIEEKANGAAVISTLKSHVSGILPVNPHKKKEIRLENVAPLFEAGNVFIPMNAPYTHDYVEELISFPDGVNDDMVDTTSQLLEKMAIDRRSIKIYDNISDYIM